MSKDKILPRIAELNSIKTSVEKDKVYYWCSCGLSNNQPFCDGSHAGTNFTPVPYKADISKNVFFCGCKHSQNSPICDGSHKTIML